MHNFLKKTFPFSEFLNLILKVEKALNAYCDFELSFFAVEFRCLIGEFSKDYLTNIGGKDYIFGSDQMGELIVAREERIGNEKREKYSFRIRDTSGIDKNGSAESDDGVFDNDQHDYQYGDQNTKEFSQDYGEEALQSVRTVFKAAKKN